MGFDPLTLALVSGGISAVSSLSQTAQANRQAEYMAEASKAQAQAARNQALVAEEKGRLESENLDRQRSALRREYADLQAGNVARLGALGVDMSSGSAAATLEGNAARFAQDVGVNRYQQAVTDWETRQNVNALNTQAQNYDASASYYKNTVQGLGSSLLTAGLSGLTSGLQTYAMTGGFGGIKAASGTAGATSGQYWDRALQKYVSSPVRH